MQPIGDLHRKPPIEQASTTYNRRFGSQVMTRVTLQRFGLIVLVATMAVALGPRSALAHTGINAAHDLLHGLRHPLTGLDHVLAMFAVGLWAAQLGGRAIWYVPVTFVVAMTLGTFLGIWRVPILFVEPGIAISVLTLSLMLAAGLRMPLSISSAIVALFAILHGHAHGAEIPAASSGTAYAAGLIAATILLEGAGVSCGLAAQRLQASHIVRYAGAAIAVFGLFLCAS